MQYKYLEFEQTTKKIALFSLVLSVLIIHLYAIALSAKIDYYFF